MAYDYKKHFGEITLTQDLTTLPDERPWRLQAPERDAEPHQIVLYLGCNVLRTSHMIRTVTAIFDRLGLDYIAVGGPTYCCGIVHHRNGDTAASGGMNKRTVELFQRYKPEEVVMWCPSCMFFYDEIQKFDWPFPVRHTTEFLADRLPSIEFTHRIDATVALHYHSQSEPRLREGAAGRRLLEAVPGLRLVDVGSEPRFGRLCTVDVQAQLGQQVWDSLILDEIDRARAGGAGTLATIYHGCQRLICGFEAERPRASETVEIGLFTEFEWRPGVDEAQAFDDFLAQVTVAEDLGYDAVWLAELHFQKERSVLSSPLVVGATIAGRTKRVKIGFAVQVLPLIHPLRLAEDVATLDQVSKGRLDFGVGRSGLPGHYTGFNIPYEESQERFDETLEILLKAWTEERFTYEGKYFQFHDVCAIPKPYQKPHPPLRVAATSEESYAAVGRRGLPIV